jgi:hypothetical protein
MGTITETDYPRLKCKQCGTRSPTVSVHEKRVPFTPEYRTPSLVRVWPQCRRP